MLELIDVIKCIPDNTNISIFKRVITNENQTGTWEAVIVNEVWSHVMYRIPKEVLHLEVDSIRTKSIYYQPVLIIDVNEDLRE